MEKNENKKIKIFSNLKQQKILELQEKINKGKSVKNKKKSKGISNTHKRK